jgi:hypothetical protein
MNQTFTMTEDEVLRHRADAWLPPHPDFRDAYSEAVSFGREIAASSSVILVAICRNAMPWLSFTLRQVEETGGMFRDWSAFIFENDSHDGTQDVLREWHDGGQRSVSLNKNGRPHLNHTTARARTEALAEYRSACQDEVRRRGGADYVIVFDADPWGGWSVDGVATSLPWIDAEKYAVMASYSHCELSDGAKVLQAQYDAFAARLNHWTHSGDAQEQGWFHHWRPRIGSPPVRFNSAFGQLAVYRGDVYLRGRYGGEDCEHVTFHRSLRAPLALNPSSRCVSFWVPENGGKHRAD